MKYNMTILKKSIGMLALAWGIPSSMVAQNQGSHLMIAVGGAYPRTLESTISYEKEMLYHNAWEYFATYSVQYDEDPEAKHITRKSFWHNHNTWGVGAVYKPCVGRGRNHHGSLRIGASAGSDFHKAIGAVHVGYEHTYNLYDGWSVFFAIRKTYPSGVRTGSKPELIWAQKFHCNILSSKTMKKTYISIFCGLLAILFQGLLVSCDEHEPMDYGIHVGYVLCDDHSCMDTTTYFSQTSKKAVGVVFTEATEEHPAMAVMLKEFQEAFSDSLGVSQGTSMDIESYDGFTNTIAMFNSTDQDTGKGSPIAQEMFHFHSKGQSDFIPSVAEQRVLIRNAPSINPLIMRLGGQPIDLSEDTWYWTSTEVKENPGYQAWLCSSVNGGIIETPKTMRHKVRAIVNLNYPD